MKLAKKSISKIVIVVVSLLVLVTFLGNMYTKPVKFEKTFSDTFVTVDLKTKQKSSNIVIDGYLRNKISFKNLFNGEKVLEGTITIDDKKYDLFGYNLGETTNNLMFGELKETKIDATPKFIIYMFDDLNSLYLSSFENENKKYIAAPASTLQEFEVLRDKIKRESK